MNRFTDLVLDLADRLNGQFPTAPSDEFDPASHGITVQLGHFNTAWGSWDQRDLSELPPIGSSRPAVDTAPASLPGTWVRMPRESFTDRLMLISYQMNGRARQSVRLMCNSTEEYRIWLDGEFLHGAQGSSIMFPAPHMPPVGQYVDFTLPAGVHELAVVIKRPPLNRDDAEWVLALVERPSMLWIENAFRPISEATQRTTSLQ